ncbi:glycosyltransferase family 39 protein [Aeromicrobium terrae]|uniref:Uncharacterized protein n=1 Tax=Aeromicrobium terrae TaxID=2498846 RepID=A0A5C8NLT3_9ACTN|nr:glycosyltransferase family 39 protein [Aeromicrobium terrae]TXL61865.1 hypothetical protein FHP06_03835 [Aeromicrobium terrae]
MAATPPRTRVPAWWWGVLVAVLLMVAARLPFLGDAPGRDEAGYLLVGHGWGDGPAVYGRYWVDRPPLLVWILQLAGDVDTLRLIGLVASALTVVGVACAARIAAGRSTAVWAAAATATFFAAHWLGVARVNGEMLAAPFVAWSMAAAAYALLGDRRRRLPAAVLAGALGAGAMLVKQTIVDGLVFALALAAVLAWQDRRSRRDVGRVVAAGAAGAVLTVAVALLAAAARGTTPVELFDALVRFRFDAGEVIRRSASGATTQRLFALLATWAGSGLAVITVLAVRHAHRSREPVLLAALATVIVTSVTALLGGSYWAHYLQQLVPAIGLAAGLLTLHLRPRVATLAAAAVLAVTVGNVVWAVAARPNPDQKAEVVGAWLRDASQPGDTVVVTFGQANIVRESGLDSPYPYLWSLPVRTLDPRLTELARVLDGPDRPTFLVDWSRLDSTWGVDPATVQPILDEHYERVARVCGRFIWMDRDVKRSLPAEARCP